MKKLNLITAFFLVLPILLAPLSSWAAAGKVVIAAGEVFAIDAQQQRRPLQRRADIFAGDTLVTGADGQLQLRFEDNAILALRADSQLRISEYHGATDGQSERVLMDLLGGGFRTISGSFGKSERDAYQVRTPNASIGIRGTHYEAVLQSETLTVGVYEGGISLRNQRGELNLGLDSNFVFAEVEANNIPRGLLNPPEILNLPNTDLRQQDSEDDEQEETEESADSDADTSEADEIAPIDGPANAELNVINADPETINISTLEDILNDNAGQLRGDPRLTDDEENALANSDQTGFLVFAPGSLLDEFDAGGNPDEGAQEANVLFNYSAAVTGSNPFYGASAEVGDDEFTPLLDFDPAQSRPLVIVQTEGLTKTDVVQHTEYGVEWGLWNASASNPAQTYSNPESGLQTGTVDQPFYYVLAEPTTAALAGKSFYSGECEANCFSVNLPEGTTFEGYLTVGINDPNLTATGNLNFVEPDTLNNWDINYSGAFLSDGQMVGIITGQLDIPPAGSGGSYDLSGAVYGIFSGSDNNLVFVGGLNASVDGDIAPEDLEHLSTDELYGVYLLPEGELPPPQ